jgi:hypothetical protein
VQPATTTYVQPAASTTTVTETVGVPSYGYGSYAYGAPAVAAVAPAATYTTGYGGYTSGAYGGYGAPVTTGYAVSGVAPAPLYRPS